ncbi:hypothetical protein HDE_06790 [Halotydeus destructor]|nr:hypothetical protein HDE_06790 [Halotydeus destructor]
MGNQDSSLCQYTVQLPHPHIKHILLDFVSFELAPPTRRGECFQDKFVVEGVAEGTRVLPLCGHNTKQHLVLPINRKAHNSVLIKLITSGLFDRKYHIKISMLEDGNPMLPPDGCTQYIAGALEGTVSSLNYKDSSSRTIDGMRYSTCFRKETGFCGVEFSKVYFDLGSMSGKETASGDGATGEAEEVVNSGNTTEVVEGSNSTAPNSTEVPVGEPMEEPMATNGTNAQVNRCQGSDRIGFPPSANSTKCPCSLCGTDFNDGRPLTVNVQPLIMFYESGRRHGKGFSLKYRYVIC